MPRRKFKTNTVQNNVVRRFIRAERGQTGQYGVLQESTGFGAARASAVPPKPARPTPKPAERPKPFRSQPTNPSAFVPMNPTLVQQRLTRPPRKPEIPIGIDPGSELTGAPVDDLHHAFRQQAKSLFTVHRSEFDPNATTYNAPALQGGLTVDVTPVTNQVWNGAKGGVLSVTGAPKFVKFGNASGPFQHWLVGTVSGGRPKYYKVVGHFKSDSENLGNPTVRAALGKAIATRSRQG